MSFKPTPITTRRRSAIVGRTLSPAEKTLRIWFAEHPGVIAEVMQECHNVSRQFVNMVANGQRSSTGGVVEAALKRKGCPVIAKGQNR